MYILVPDTVFQMCDLGITKTDFFSIEALKMKSHVNVTQLKKWASSYSYLAVKGQDTIKCNFLADLL